MSYVDKAGQIPPIDMSLCRACPGSPIVAVYSYMKIGEVAYPHIVKKADEPARLESHPRTRVAMLVADYLWRGWSAEEIVRHYPYLTLAEVHAALGYYFDHREEIDTELLEESRGVDAWRKSHPLHQS